MKKLLFAVVLGLMAWGCASVPQEDLQYKNYLVYYDGIIGKDALFKAIEKTGSEVLYEYNNFNAIAIRVPLKKSAEKMQAYFEKVNGVVYLQEDQVNLLN